MGVGACPALVRDRDVQLRAVLAHVDPHLVDPGVFDGVRHRLGDHEPGGALDRGREPRVRDLAVDADGQPAREVLHRRDQTAARQRRGLQSGGEVAQFLHGHAEVRDRAVHFLAQHGVVTIEAGSLQLQCDGEDPLLRAVVEVALGQCAKPDTPAHSHPGGGNARPVSDSTRCRVRHWIRATGVPSVRRAGAVPHGPWPGNLSPAKVRARLGGGSLTASHDGRRAHRPGTASPRQGRA